MTKGLTGCTENVRGFLGRKPLYKKTKSGAVVYFDISWGLNDPESNRYGTWRHCIAYNQNADKLKNCKPGTFLVLTGWIVTNPVYNEAGIKQYSDGKLVTKEYLVIETATVIERDKPQQNTKQLTLLVE
jgi:single-stranded DNA-binding protein